MFLAVLILCACIILTPQLSSASELSVTKTVYIEQGLQPDPYAIVRTRDDGFVIAGTITEDHEGWATRTDSDGKVLWRYVVPLADKLGKGDGGMYPTYKSAAVMPDDSVFLCGSMPRSLGNKDGAGGLLTHLDKNGNRISEVLIKPLIEKNLNGNLSACMPWKDGVIAVGNAGRITRTYDINAANPIVTSVEYFYWILALNQDGSTKWERLVPVAEFVRGFTSPIKSLQSFHDGGFVFAAYKSGVSEVVHIGPDGNVVAKETFGANITIIPTDPHDPHVHIASSDIKSLLIASLDDQLKIVDSSVENYGQGSALSGVFSLSNNLLLLFGDKGLPQGQIIPQAMTISTQHKQGVEIAFGAVGESFAIGGVCPGINQGTFVSVRKARVPVRREENIAQSSDKDRLLGVAIDFVKTSY